MPGFFQIFGVLNCTPDSFYDGGVHKNIADFIEQGLSLQTAGADVIDIGGESTRPGALSVSVAQELDRVEPVVEGIRRRSDVPISLDTTKYEVAKFLSDRYPIQYLNDVSGFSRDPRMIDLARERRLKLIVMHTRGTPETMADLTQYDDTVRDVCAELGQTVQLILNSGVSKDQIIIDPGFGFAKTAAQNIELLAKLELLHQLGYPVLVGMSRKSFIGAMLDEPNPADRLYGSLAATLIAAMKGVFLHRVHDVEATRDVLRVYRGIL